MASSTSHSMIIYVRSHRQHHTVW